MVLWLVVVVVVVAFVVVHVVVVVVITSHADHGGDVMFVVLVHVVFVDMY